MAMRVSSAVGSKMPGPCSLGAARLASCPAISQVEKLEEVSNSSLTLVSESQVEPAEVRAIVLALVDAVKGC